jgi:cytidylate kinase
MEKKKKFISIAIDGPSGAGKSTMARIIAERFGFLYIDTGALYRAVGLAAYREGIGTDNAEKISELAGRLKVRIAQKNGRQLIFLNDEDVTDKIRSEHISKYASAVSAVPKVREMLLEAQREFARKNNVIMDGRDIATVVLPDADIKIFLTASPEERARRRYDELKERGEDVNFNGVLSAIISRDKADSTRAISPLKKHPDAVLVDTTGNTREQSVEMLIKLIKERLGVAV